MAELPQTYKLSEAEKKYFDENGFLVIKGLIDFSTLYSCKQRFSQICNGVVDKGFIQIVKDPTLIATGATGEDLVNKAQDLHFDDVFSLFTENPRLLDVMGQLIGDDVSIIHSMLINKPPGTTHHLPHQDMYYFPFRPAEWIIGTWTAIDPVDPDNGCLFVIPGSHRANTLYEHGATPGSNRLYHSILNEELVAPKKWVNLEMSPGDTLVFHPLLVHGSLPNVSKRYRKAMTIHYGNSHCWTGGVSKPLAEDVKEAAKRKGLDITYTDLWLYKRKHVKGALCKL